MCNSIKMIAFGALEVKKKLKINDKNLKFLETKFTKNGHMIHQSIRNFL